MAASNLVGERPLAKSEWRDEVHQWVMGPYGTTEFGASNKVFILPFLHPRDIVIDSVKLLVTGRTGIDTVYFMLAKAAIDATTRVVTSPTCAWTGAVPTLASGAKQVTAIANIGDTSGITALRMEDLPLVKGYGTARATSFVGGVAPGDALWSGGASFGEPYNNVVEAGNLLVACCSGTTDDSGATDMAGLLISIRGRERKTY